MKEVYVKTTEPQESEGFNNATYMNATLYVPEGTVSKYQQTSPWNNFFEIKEWDGKTDVKTIKYDNKEGSKQSYDINGRKIDNNHKGFIIRNGKKYINN